MNFTRQASLLQQEKQINIDYNPQAMRDRYPENSDTCSSENIWGVTTGGEFKVTGMHIVLSLILEPGLWPEVFFKPQEVWEIRGAE